MTSLDHNRELMLALIAKAGNPPRYPAVSQQAECLPLDTSKLPPFAYNPSIFRTGDKTLLTYRYHHKNDYFTRIGIAEIGEGGSVLSTQDLVVSESSCEDAHLFLLHGEPWMCWVEAPNPGAAILSSVIKYAQLELTPAWQQQHGGWHLMRIYQPAPHVNDGKSLQKNWCFFESDENLFCIYRSTPEQIIFQIQGDTVINERKTPPVRWPWGDIRGGVIVPWEGHLLRIFHSSTERGIDKREKRWYIGACLMESKPPHATLKISLKPVLYGSDGGPNTPANWCIVPHPGVVFPCGMVADGDGFILAVGVNDAACTLVKLKKEMLHL